MTVMVVSDGCAGEDEPTELRLMGGGTRVNEEGSTVGKLVVVLRNPLVVVVVEEDERVVVNAGGVTMVKLRLLVMLGKPLTEEGGGGGGGRGELLLEFRGGGGSTLLLVTLGKPGVLLGGGGSKVILILLELLTGDGGGSGDDDDDGTTLALLVALNRPDVVVKTEEDPPTTEEVVTPVPVGPTKVLLPLLVGNGTVLRLRLLLLLLEVNKAVPVDFVVKFCRLVDGGSRLEKEDDDVTLMVGRVVKRLEVVVLKYPLLLLLLMAVVKLARDEGAVRVTVMFSTRVMVTCLTRVVAGAGQLEGEEEVNEDVLVSPPAPYVGNVKVKAGVAVDEDEAGACRCSRMFSSLSQICYCAPPRVLVSSKVLFFLFSFFFFFLRAWVRKLT